MNDYISRKALLDWVHEFYPEDKVFASAIINAPAACAILSMMSSISGIFFISQEKYFASGLKSPYLKPGAAAFPA